MPTQQMTQMIAHTMTPAVKKKTPTARVVAALWLLDALDTADDHVGRGLDPATLKVLADSRVSAAKAAKVIAQINKSVATLRVRMQKVVDKFEGKGPPSATPRKPPTPPKRKAKEPAAAPADPEQSA